MIKNKDVIQNKGFCKKTKTRCALDPLLTKHDDECFMNAATGYCNVIKGNKGAAPPAAESAESAESEYESESETSIILGDHLKLNSAPTIYIVDYIDENIIFLKNSKTLAKSHLNITDGKLSPLNGEKIQKIVIIKRENDPKFTVQSKFEIGMNLSITLSLTSHPVLYCTIMDINDELDSLVVRVYKFETLVLDNADAYNIHIHFGCRGIPEWIHNIEIQKGVYSAASAAIDVGDAVAEKEKGEEYEIDLNLLEEGETFIANILYELPDIEKVVSIEKQYQSFLQNIIETIPNDKRSPTQLNAIYNSIERYIQLRTAFSSINQNGVAQILPHVEKPILDHLSDMDMDAISWIVPVVSNKKKIYKKGDGSDIDIIISDHETYTIYDFFSTIRKQHEMVQSRKEYYDALRGSKIISTFFTPFDVLD